MNIIISDNGEGGVAINIPTPEILSKHKADGKSDTEAVIAVAEFLNLGGYDIVDSLTLPNSRIFRNAWENVGASVVVDMNKAKVIHLARIIEDADNKLQELNVKSLRGDDVSSDIQLVRDGLASVDLSSITDPQELDNAWPSNIPRVLHPIK